MTTITEAPALRGMVFPQPSLLAASPVQEGQAGRLAIRLSADGSDHEANRIGHLQPLARARGAGGRMWSRETGVEGDFALLNPEPEQGLEYIGWTDDPEFWVRLRRDGEGWTALANRYGPVVADDVDFHPTHWALAAVAPPLTPAEALPTEVIEAPAAVAPDWLRFVQDSTPRAGRFGRRTLLVTASPQIPGRPARPDLVGQFRRVRHEIGEHDGRACFLDDGPAGGEGPEATGAPVLGALVNAGAGGEYFLAWPDRSVAYRETVAPVLVEHRGYTLRTMADASGAPLQQAQFFADILVATTWRPHAGEAGNLATVRALAAEATSLWERWSEAMNEVADEQDWCPDYERAVVPLGFPGREGRARNWNVTVSAEATVVIDSPSAAVDRALGSSLGFSLETTRVTATGTLSVSGVVSDVDREGVGDAIDSGTVEEWLSENYGQEWEVEDYTIDEIEEYED